jgi:uncharacterized membrane protein YphA (DoxX/SURF4 family)
MNTILLATKILVATSIFFVWVVRYKNIVKEFEEYGLPTWVRDLTGILKLTFAAMLLFGQQDRYVTLLGSLGIAFLMLCAQIVHIRAGTDSFRRVPSLVLLALSSAIAYWSAFVEPYLHGR